MEVNHIMGEIPHISQISHYPHFVLPANTLWLPGSSLKRALNLPIRLPMKLTVRRRMSSASNISLGEVKTWGHSMEPILSDHSGALSAVCCTSLVLGIPLIMNTLWHLRDAIQ